MHRRYFMDSRRTRIWLPVLFATTVMVSSGLSRADPPFPKSPHRDANAQYFLGPDAKGRELKNGADLSDLDLRGIAICGLDQRYSKINFDGANLSGGNLEGADSLYTEFKNCTFRNAILRRIEADWVIDSSCDLTNADISGSRIRLSAAQLRSTLNYRTKDLSHTSIRLYDWQPGFDLANFNLQGTTFLAPAPRWRVRFSDADFTDADIGGATIRLTAEQLRSTRNYKSKDLSNTKLTGDFAGVSFRGFNLRSTAFLVCDLTGCDFTDAEIWGMSVNWGGEYDRDGKWAAESHRVDAQFTKEQLYSTKNYNRHDLDCVQFHRCNFRNADFSDQTLGFFCECDLQGADFTGADHVTGPDDSRSRPWIGLHSTSHYRESPPIGFEKCNLTAEQFYSTRIYAAKEFQPGCRMVGMDLKDWDFSDFDLRHVRFALSNMQDANLDNAYGGRFLGTSQLSLRQVKSLRNYRNGRMTQTSEFTLPKHIVKQLSAEAGEAEK